MREVDFLVGRSGRPPWPSANRCLWRDRRATRAGAARDG